MSNTKSCKQSDTNTTDTSLDENGNDVSDQHQSRKVTDIDTMCAEENGEDVRGQQYDNIETTLDKTGNKTADSHTADTLAANLQDKMSSQDIDVNIEIEIKNTLTQMITEKHESVSLH